jgi:hypothetical protein
MERVYPLANPSLAPKARRVIFLFFSHTLVTGPPSPQTRAREGFFSAAGPHSHLKRKRVEAFSFLPPSGNPFFVAADTFVCSQYDSGRVTLAADSFPRPKRVPVRMANPSLFRNTSGEGSPLAPTSDTPLAPGELSRLLFARSLALSDVYFSSSPLHPSPQTRRKPDVATPRRRLSLAANVR